MQIQLAAAPAVCAGGAHHPVLQAQGVHHVLLGHVEVGAGVAQQVARGDPSLVLVRAGFDGSRGAGGDALPAELAGRLLHRLVVRCAGDSLETAVYEVVHADPLNLAADSYTAPAHYALVVVAHHERVLAQDLVLVNLALEAALGDPVLVGELLQLAAARLLAPLAL